MIITTAMVVSALGAFTGLVVLDFVWARYVAAVAQAGPLRAGLWAVPVYVLGILVTIQVIDDPWLIPWAALGAFVGTAGSVYLDRRGKGVDL
jgi:hypothetical protein